MAEPTIDAGRLLAHVRTANTRWFKVGAWLLRAGLHNVPETRDSYNPVKWLMAQIGCWMSDVQTKQVNRRYDKGRT